MQAYAKKERRLIEYAADFCYQCGRATRSSYFIRRSEKMATFRQKLKPRQYYSLIRLLDAAFS
jgi:hypothetical protein